MLTASRIRLVALCLLVGVSTSMLASCAEDAGDSTEVVEEYEGWLATLSDGEVRLVDSESGADGPLTASPGDSVPRWSPDGSRLAFIRDGDVATALVGIRPVVLTDLARHGMHATDLSFSPDGSQLAVTIEGSNEGSSGALGLIEVDTGDLSLLFESAGAIALGGWWNHPGLAFDQVIVHEEALGAVLAVSAIDGTAFRVVEGRLPRPHPIDGRLLFARGNKLLVWSAPDEVVSVVSEATDVVDASWSPGGDEVLYKDERGVFVTSAGGADTRRVAEQGTSPTWSHDGRTVVLSIDGEVVRVDAVSGTRAAITRGTGASSRPTGSVTPAPRTGARPPNLVQVANSPQTVASVASVASVETVDPGQYLPVRAFEGVDIHWGPNNYSGLVSDLAYLGGAAQRLYVTARDGKVWTFENTPRSGGATLFLEVPHRINIGPEGGLLAIALDPGFTLNGYFYVFYTTGGVYDEEPGLPEGPRRNTLSRFQVEPGSLRRADPGSELVILELFPEAQTPNQHNAGRIAFDPDGFLYLSIGDGADMASSQDLSNLFGSIIRIDVQGATPEAPYRVPTDNPFVGDPDARGEIWAHGFRNPWRFAIDPLTGRIWVADVGVAAQEEVDLMERGGNYGWPYLEGNIEAEPGACDQVDCDAFDAPKFVYEHESPGLSAAIVGGIVYRGSAMPELFGSFLFADWVSGTFWALRESDDGTIEVFVLGVVPEDARGVVSGIVAGPGGEPYVIYNDHGTIDRLFYADESAAADHRGPGLIQGLSVADFYLASCAACHGTNREGGVGPPLTSDLLVEPDAFYEQTIAEGRTGTMMPSWREGGLADQQIASLVDWLKSSTP